MFIRQLNYVVALARGQMRSARHAVAAMATEEE